jgi:2-dehydropantoate 2-reductase
MNSASPTPVLSLAIIGAGRIGSALAYQLRRAGHDVTVVARPNSRRLTQLRHDGGIVLTTSERAEVTVADRFDETKPFDLVIVTVLAHQVDALLPDLQRSRARCVHFMFVTPQTERLRSVVGADRATFGMAAVLATLDSDGRLGLTIPKTKAMQGDQRWVDLFQAAGMPSKLEQDMGRWLRSHVPMTIAMEAVAVAGMRHKRGATWTEARTGARSLRAGYSILRGLGETPYPGSKNQISRAPRLLLTLMLRAVSSGRFRETLGNSAAECRGLIDLMVTEAGQKPALHKAVEAMLQLRPAETTSKRTTPSPHA